MRQFSIVWLAALVASALVLSANSFSNAPLSLSLATRVSLNSFSSKVQGRSGRSLASSSSASRLYSKVTDLNFPKPPSKASSSLFPTDSMASFESDCAKVFEQRKGKDQSLPKNMESSQVRDYQHIWTNDEWESHIDRWRYIRHIAGLPTSRILRRVYPVLLVLAAWSAFAVRMQKQTKGNFSMPLTPITLLSSFVALLLTMRTNQSLSRILEGRLAWGRTVLLTRDTSQLLAAYVYPKNKVHGLLAGKSVLCKRVVSSTLPFLRFC
jgi:hypothetical protein